MTTANTTYISDNSRQNRLRIRASQAGARTKISVAKHLTYILHTWSTSLQKEQTYTHGTTCTQIYTPRHIFPNCSDDMLSGRACCCWSVGGTLLLLLPSTRVQAIIPWYGTSHSRILAYSRAFLPIALVTPAQLLQNGPFDHANGAPRDEGGHTYYHKLWDFNLLHPIMSSRETHPTGSRGESSLEKLAM